MRYFANLALPERAYRPGSGEAKPTLTHDGLDAPLTRDGFRRHVALGHGIDLFNHGFFWEAHEVWETSWKQSEGRERELLQALIQLAAAKLQRARGHDEGAARLVDRARGHIEAARGEGAILCGVDLDALGAETSRIVWRRRSRDLPGTLTDLAVQPLECRYALAAAGVVQTSTRDDYHSGNTIFLDDPVWAVDSGQVERWRELCRREIDVPTRFHNVCWEIEGNAVGAIGGDDDGFEQLVVLRATTLKQTPPPVPGVVIRPLEGDDDWRAAADLGIELNVHEWGPGTVAFTRWRYASFRQTVELFGGAFFGAFAGDELAACLGAVTIAGSFRYQDVQTRVAFRRRGIARAMCAHAFAAMSARGASPGIIIADAGSIAETIYRRLGFEQVSTMQALKLTVAEE